MLNELLLISLVLKGIECQLSQLSLSATESLIHESVSCACNFSTDFCDEYCCCDSKCDSNTIVEWDLARKCREKIYSSAYQIPECNRDYQKSSSDLYLGLRIAYNLFKNLGCVTNQNTLSTLQNKELDSKDYTAKIEEYISKFSSTPTFIGLSTENYITSTLINQEMTMIKDVNQVKLEDIRLTLSLYVQDVLRYSIIQELTDDQITPLLLTEFKYSNYLSLTIWGLSVKVSATYQITYNDATKRYQYATITTPTDPVGKTNMVVGVIYQFNMAAVPIDDTEKSGKPTSIDATIFMIDAVQVNADAVNIIPAISGIIYKTVKGEAYDISSKGGYSRGAPLRFKKSLDNTNEELLQQLFIGVESYDGLCISSTTKDVSHSFQIKFLEDQKISCSKSSISFSTSNIYKNVADNLKFVARYGDSGSNNLSTDEWLLVSPCSSTDSYQFSLTFGYIVYGEKGKERFRINSASLICTQVSIDAAQYEYRFYIQFIEIPNTWTHFKGPSPQLIGGLPDDILAPFINYG
ncbi:unnamed protein product (macronuclear) [Paramecium tetraurelia]|uniref:Tectonic domain-containing protein n=1 Tax=Paramecium tetraurelia TaxID=5888 RepID=A0DD42_PARTE|nr:uncharacterized protein GSPATT00015818001 [Paramecium tetraurelia]CAK80959.1 unnamed protein product [Paramecium tetraurelia]|eukprot:XP_001448356.1 hypothetical protein (macronuclear) [Paramecium tetraurelia strain d4-2]